MIKLNAGFSRKTGEPNYGSRGASVNLELELESSVIDSPDKMHDRIRALFSLARKAVDEELQNGNPNTRDNGRPAKSDTKSPEGPVCSNCGSDSLSEKVIKYSTDKFGRVLCYPCQKKLDGRERR